MILSKAVQNCPKKLKIVQNGQIFFQNCPKWSKNCPKLSNMVQVYVKFVLKTTAVGATAVGVTAVRNNLNF